MTKLKTKYTAETSDRELLSDAKTIISAMCAQFEVMDKEGTWTYEAALQILPALKDRSEKLKK